MNLFGVLKYKKMGEDFVCNSGIPFTIIRFVYRKSVSVGTSWIYYSDMVQAVCRAGRLTDGPYTSYDLNTLLKATAGERRAVVIGKGYFFCYHTHFMMNILFLIRSLLLLTLPHILLGDKLVGEVSRLVVAEACIQALDIESTEGQIYEINSVKVLMFFL